MNDIKVTVWCLTYNHEKYIEKALQSFVSQKTSFLYEVLIHDDASTDNTVEIIEKYRNLYPNIIKPIYEKNNLYKNGIDYSTFICLPNANGKYIAFCEGDDYWIDNNKLQKQYELMESNPNFSLCVGKTKCTNEDDSYNSLVIPKDKTDRILKPIISGEEFIQLFFANDRYPFHTSTYFIRKDVIDINSIYFKLYGYLNGDNRILLSSAAIGDIGYIDQEISNRRLMTNGNWNVTFENKNENEKFEYHSKQIKGFILYRDLLDNKCNDAINYGICNYITRMANMFDINKVYFFYKDLNNIKMPNYGSFVNRIKFKLFKFNPKLYKKAYRIKKLFD